MLPGLESSGLPDDAIEVGRILDAWGVKGWVKILAHSASSEALFSSSSWFLQPPDAKHHQRHKNHDAQDHCRGVLN